MNDPSSLRGFALAQMRHGLEEVTALVTRAAQSQDEEAVHGLRVGIRRFRQALAFFPGEEGRKVKRSLKGLMRVSSEVRNRDIALEYLDGPKHEALKARLRKERATHAAALEREARSFVVEDPAVEWCGDDPVPPALYAVAELPKLAKKYFAAGRDAARGHQPPRELHRFRIRTKRFRYALEMFSPLYGPELRERIDSLRRLQQILGKISDAYTIRRLLKRETPLRKELRAETTKRIRSFRDYWKSTFDAPGAKTGWTAALKASRNDGLERSEE